MTTPNRKIHYGSTNMNSRTPTYIARKTPATKITKVIPSTPRTAYSQPRSGCNCGNKIPKR